MLVGGATRMIPVRNLITRLFKRFPEHALDPDTVVALGAAVQAGLIAKRFKELERIKVHPRDEAVNEALISRITAAFGNTLGQRRIEVGMLLDEFEAAQRTYDKRQIAQVRGKVENTLKAVEDAGVFD